MILVFIQRLTGSFAMAGTVTAAYALGSASGAPALGRLVDRVGQTAVLVVSATVSAVLLVAMALIPADVPRAVLVLLAGGIGAATPPVNGCIRTLLPEVASNPAALPAVYAVESTGLELTFIFGPPLALGIAVWWSPRAALAAAGIVLLVATLGFAAQPVSRKWLPTPGRFRPRGGSLRSPAIRALATMLSAVGILFGATEVGITATATHLGDTGAAGVLLALWGVGSLLGGVVAAKAGGGARSARGLAMILGVLSLGHGALIATTANLTALGVVVVLAGAAIAPAYASIYVMVDRIAPPGTVTEAFTWLSTAAVAGASIGMAAGGFVAQHIGTPAVFGLAGSAGTVAVAITMLRSKTLFPSCASIPGLPWNRSGSPAGIPALAARGPNHYAEPA